MAASQPQGSIAIPSAPLREQDACPLSLPPPYTAPQPAAPPAPPRSNPAAPNGIDVTVSQPVSIAGSSNEINLTAPVETLLATLLGNIANSMALSMQPRQHNAQNLNLSNRTMGCGGVQLTVHCPITINGDCNVVSLESNAPNVVYLPVPMGTNRVMMPNGHPHAARMMHVAQNPLQQRQQQQQPVQAQQPQRPQRQQQQQAAQTQAQVQSQSLNQSPMPPRQVHQTAVSASRKRKAEDSIPDAISIPEQKKIHIGAPMIPEPESDDSDESEDEAVDVRLESESSDEL